MKYRDEGLDRSAFLDVTECLVAALEARDIYTEGHSLRVADLSVEIAAAMGVSGEELEDIHMAAHLHDIGKIGISDQILYKQGKLLPEEYEEIKRHPEIGYTILSKSKNLMTIAKIVLCHHERWDGGGYPLGLCGEFIPRGSRIIAVADTIDAMTSCRPYREEMSLEFTMEEVLRNAGLQFDPAIARLVYDLFRQNRLPGFQSDRQSPRRKVKIV
ncbi:metal dependent phosphohydrolase [Sporobacter termitidis DSM 10068]|uniref:Metal dependent phosphohydrolase n=1 Tax=Sporobacter termitidis DSM 10068 TaxID=1123282 RepID=A0A1M5XH90_9FIRM|nr:HD-GYP domain-containing protein [Sporobacter termitidis]SHH99245.1 metal dependent phosphohydrolase [Sporobacter termitidis DSM 10068]